MNTKNSATPDSWENVATIANSSAWHLWEHVVHWGAEWHLKNRPLPFPVELVDALRVTSFCVFVRGLPVPLGFMTARERAEHMAEHIRRLEPVVFRMLERFSNGPGNAQVPESLEAVFWTLKNATDAADRVERAAAAHDAATDALFNPEGHA